MTFGCRGKWRFRSRAVPLYSTRSIGARRKRRNAWKNRPMIIRLFLRHKTRAGCASRAHCGLSGALEGKDRTRGAATDEVAETLLALMRSPNESTRLSACREILDRVSGRAAIAIDATHTKVDIGSLYLQALKQANEPKPVEAQAVSPEHKPPPSPSAPIPGP
jgi:hypothetical protein